MEATMKTTSQNEVPFSRLLLSWMAYHISQAMAAIRPMQRASHIATRVAASGNPSGV
jgi:hypothetical protein